MKDKIIIALSIALAILLYLYLSKDEVIKEVTKTEIRIDTITKVIDNTKPTEIKRVVIRVPVEVIKTDTITKVIYKDKEVTRYKYIDSLTNGIIKSIILADNIYKRDVTLKTFNKTITTETIRTVVKSDLYFGGMITLGQNKSVLNKSLNVFYTHKGKWLITGGFGYSDVPNISFGIALKF